MGSAEIFAEHKDELGLDVLILPHAVAQQREHAGSLADGASPGGFVRDSLSDLVLHEVEEVEDEGCEFGVSGRCHLRLRSVAMPDV